MQPLDFNNPEITKEVAAAMMRAVDKAIEQDDTEGYRSHLGASVIGNECTRYLFYHFRWMHKEQHTGRMIRLFAVGHGLETRVRRWLTAIGFEFIDGFNETGVQPRFSSIAGHFGGSVDGVFIAPQWGIFDPTLLECKTSGTGAGFNNIGVKGVRQTKEGHYIQDSVYGYNFQLKNMLYVAENKNDSDWIFELTPLDWNIGQDAQRKAEFIILQATEPPKKINQKRNFFLCNMCSMQGICHDNKPTDVNCRSCRNSKPVDEAKWLCTFYNQIIPSDAILAACPQHNPIQP